jgi:hypothetical protein
MAISNRDSISSANSFQLASLKIMPEKWCKRGRKSTLISTCINEAINIYLFLGVWVDDRYRKKGTCNVSRPDDRKRVIAYWHL